MYVNVASDRKLIMPNNYCRTDSLNKLNTMYSIDILITKGDYL